MAKIIYRVASPLRVISCSGFKDSGSIFVAWQSHTPARLLLPVPRPYVKSRCHSGRHDLVQRQVSLCSERGESPAEEPEETQEQKGVGCPGFGRDPGKTTS